MKTKFSLSMIPVIFLLSLASIEKGRPLFKLDSLKDYVEIPKGRVSLASNEYDIERFYILRYEVTNSQYQEFLESLREKGDNQSLSAAEIKNNNWKKIDAAGTPEESYHAHASFANFPVVNITYEGAQLYCQWLTNKINQETKFAYEIEVRLPSREEWIRAARGQFNHKYAWESPYLEDKKGHFLCNFKKLGAEQISYNFEKQEYELVKLYDGPDATLTEPFGNYAPNIFGLYDMCGNVAEMVSEKGKAVGGNFDSPGYDVRVESIVEFYDASPKVGFRPILTVKN
jgi:formylglycine-generating enzyme required for sulfatase activity